MSVVAIVEQEAADVSEDQIVETASLLEKLGPTEAFSMVPQLIDNVDHSYFKLGGVLSVINSHDWYKTEGFENFKLFVEGKFGIQYRKAMYLIAIYDTLVDAGIPWAAVKGLGWSKLKELASVLTKENVAEWVQKVQGLTVLQIQELVKQAKSGTLSNSGTVPEANKTVTTLTFKVHPDQKETVKQAIAKAREESKTEFDAVALEAIALNYLTGAVVSVKPKSLVETIQNLKLNPEDVLAAFESIWPDIDLQVKLPA